MAPREQDSIPTEAIGTPSSFKIFGKAMELPIVNDAIVVATKLHTEAVTYPYVNQVETIIGGLVTKAEDTITPHVSSTMTSTVTSTLTQLDTLACTGLDQVTGKVPALKLPTGELATATTDATLNLVNTIQDYVAKLTVVRVLLTAFGMVLGFSIKGLETVLGLLEGKAEMSPATITGVVKPVLGHINTFKLLLEEIVKRSKLIDVTKPVEELREETHEEELREETHEEELREETHEEEELREETHKVEEELEEDSEKELEEDSEKELEEDSEKELEEDSEKELEDSEEELGEDSRRLTNRK